MNAQPAKLKSVEYSYPSSPNAVRCLGKLGNRKGCYCVKLHDGQNPPVIVGGAYEDSEAGRSEAVIFANTLPNPWSPLHLRYNPQDALQTA